MTASPISNEMTVTPIGLRPIGVTEQKTPLHLVVQEGQLQVHTAPFRGSFSGVLSEALRAAGLGSKVLIAQFLKGGVNQGPTEAIQLCGRLKWMRPDISCCINKEILEKSSYEDQIHRQDSVRAIWNKCSSHLIKGDLDQLVLDEIGLAIDYGYLNEKELVSALEQRPSSMDVILTGPSIPTKIIDMADQVTKSRCSY